MSGLDSNRTQFRHGLSLTFPQPPLPPAISLAALLLSHSIVMTPRSQGQEIGRLYRFRFWLVWRHGDGRYWPLANTTMTSGNADFFQNLGLIRLDSRGRP